ncbi:hypothetical protein LWI29_026043 [Acer saccharum]|uniref:Uncharacterized protein n=1 Tax=Acer saccharum TaxID=4024 RepID=A0AA39SXE5_ACESA|nr:hypothetical protein LWI29_026043 [Acer saccharum]
MDEISTVLDSQVSTLKCLQPIVHLTEASILMSLLQPTHEMFDFFDDIILLSEGQIVYEGPREHILLFFETCGFRCPERKSTAVFLQELLGLYICKDTIVGDEMQRGMSGGQKKRVTTAPPTYQIVKCMQQIAQLTEATILMSLLQPDLETFDIFDDIILLSKGQIVYQGPREHVLEFFESFGFKCPERKGIADYLQEAPGNVTSLSVAVLEKFNVDPKKYWYWIGVAALLGFTILFNVLFTFSLIMYLNRKPQAMSSEEEANEQSNQGGTKTKVESKSNSSTGANNTRETENMKVSSQSKAVAAGEYSYVVKDGIAVKKGMILPLSMSNYFVDMPSAPVKDLSTPPEAATDLYFSTQCSQSTWEQFKSCLWKQWWTYWRSPDYNLVRFCFTFIAALVLGTIFWQVGTKRENSTDLTMIIEAIAAGMYSTLPYALAQVIVEILYIFVQTTYYSLIVYAMVSFEWTLSKFIWFFFITFFSFLYFTYYGMMTVSITPNHHAAAIVASAFYALFTLFSSFFIPKPRIPKW